MSNQNQSDFLEKLNLSSISLEITLYVYLNSTFFIRVCILSFYIFTDQLLNRNNPKIINYVWSNDEIRLKKDKNLKSLKSLQITCWGYARGYGHPPRFIIFIWFVSIWAFRKIDENTEFSRLKMANFPKFSEIFWNLGQVSIE